MRVSLGNSRVRDSRMPGSERAEPNGIGFPGIRRSKFCLIRDIARLVEGTMLIGEDAASEITHLKPPHCGCRYISTELRYAAILPISAASQSARNTQASRVKAALPKSNEGNQ